MRTIFWVGLALAAAGAAATAACTSDEPAQAVVVAPDGGTSDGASPPSQYLLFATSGYSAGDPAELVAFDLGRRTVDGRTTLTGGDSLVDTSGPSPFFVAQTDDFVAKLDRNQPWQLLSSWNVKGTDAPGDAGFFLEKADPQGVIVVADTKAYVVRRNRNAIVVIDPTAPSDGGPATRSIDLGSLWQPADTDGVIDAIAGFYVPSTRRVYLVLANSDPINATWGKAGGYAAKCLTSRSTIAAIDTTTDTIVSLGGAGPQGSIALDGYGATSAVLDARQGRILVLSAGCKELASDAAVAGGDAGDAGPSLGPSQRKLVEEVSLTASTPRPLLDLNATSGFANKLTLVDARTVLIDLGQLLVWDGVSSTLPTRTLTSSLAAYVSDGAGSLYGLVNDAGFRPSDIVSLRVADDTLTTLGPSPFTRVLDSVRVALFTQP